MEAFDHTYIPDNYQIITPDRIIGWSLTEIQPHLCYLCGNYAFDPYQCFKTSSNNVICEAIFCFKCLESYLNKKPMCPKCRSQVIDPEKDSFKKPPIPFYIEH